MLNSTRLKTMQRCPRAECGKVLVRAKRYGPTPKPLDVLCCLSGCGWESEPLACCNRFPDLMPSLDLRWSVCASCGAPVFASMYRRRKGEGRFCCNPCKFASQVRVS